MDDFSFSISPTHAALLVEPVPSPQFERALNACSECPPPLVEERRGITFYSWGEDLALDIQRRLSPPAFDQLGRGGRIAVQEECVFHTVETPGMRGLIIAATRGPSLADVEEYRLMAEGLEDLGAYTAFMTDLTLSLEDAVSLIGEGATAEQREQIRRLLEEGPLLEPYQVFATGAGLDEEGPYMAVVLVHADASAARDNVGLLRQLVLERASLFTRQPWTEMIEEVEARSQGRVFLAKLRGERAANLWLNVVIRRDSLLLHR